MNSSTGYNYVQISLSGNVPAGGGYVTLSGGVNIPDTRYSLNKNTATHIVASNIQQKAINYAKTVVASTGSIKSADGLIQSIS